MAFGIGRGVATPLLAVAFAMYVVTATMAGRILNRNIDATAGAGGYIGMLITGQCHLNNRVIL
jgi:hypothetical protein